MKADRLAAWGPATAAAAAMAMSLGALWFSSCAVHALKSQSRIELAMSLRRQFDADYKQDRADCARAYLYGADRKRRKKGLETAPYGVIMEFFDSLGYLVERGVVDEPMARYYFVYDLDGYFAATQSLMRRDQKNAPRRYENVFRLIARWRENEPRPDLNAFFQDELDFTSPPPPEEGPRT